MGIGNGRALLRKPQLAASANAANDNKSGWLGADHRDPKHATSMAPAFGAPNDATLPEGGAKA